MLAGLHACLKRLAGMNCLPAWTGVWELLRKGEVQY